MLIVVRHGRTEANTRGLLLGRTDVVLDDLGRAQAAAVASAVGDVDRVVASPLQRCQETAAAFGAPVETDERWIELDYGDLEATPVADVPPSMWAAWRADLDYVPAGGESIAELGHRVRAALDDLAESARRERVVVVTHVSPIKAALAWTLGVSDDICWRAHVAPASIMRVAVGNGARSLQSFNEVGHLADRGRLS